MKRIKTIVVLLLLALWVPVGSHCLLEAADLLPDFLCCVDECAPSGAGGGSDKDGCGTVESAIYKAEDNQSITVVAPFDSLLPELSAPSAETDVQPVFSSRPVAAPELPVTWQFSFRAAAPPRAPSSPA